MDIEALRARGDRLADAFVASLVDFGDMDGSLANIGAVLSWLRTVERNAQLEDPAFPTSMPPEVAARLRAFLVEATRTPSFADREAIGRTEGFFQERGYLASLIYMCASLPEVYVVPDISSLLHVTGRLEHAAEHRIRATATMVLSVFLEGGLLSPRGIGVVLILRARLIHAVLRVLLVRGRPDELESVSGVIPKIDGTPRGLTEAAYMNGWDLDVSKIPCNQGELLYTLLTFGFVFIRSLRRLDVALTPAEEQAFFHTWNVVGHFMGIEDEVLPRSYDEARALFESMQAMAFARGDGAEARRHLGQALLTPLERTLKQRRLRPLAVLLTQYLTSSRTLEALELGGALSRRIYPAFPASLAVLRRADQLLDRFSDVSLASELFRYLSLSIIDDILLQQPLALPSAQAEQVDALVAGWRRPHRRTGSGAPCR
jgi:hypothetical protein